MGSKYFFLLLYLPSNILDIFCANSLTNKLSNNINIKGNLLEIFDLNKGIEASRITVTKDTKVKITDKISIDANKIDKKSGTGNSQRFFFTGNPTITGPDIKITANNFIFNARNNTFEIKDNVIIKHKDITFTTNSCKFDIPRNQFSFGNNGKITKKNISITSKEGNFNTETNSITLSKNVKINADNYIIQCDLVESSNNNIKCSGEIKINDKGNNFLLTTREDAYIYNEDTIKLNKCLFNTKDFILYCNSIEYMHRLNHASLTGGIEILTKNNYTITADEGFFDYTTKSGALTKNGLIQIRLDNSKDVIYITADEFKVKLTEPKTKILKQDELDNFNIYSYKNAEYFDKEKYLNNKNTNIVKQTDKELDIQLQKKPITRHGTPFEFSAEGNVKMFSKDLKCKSNGFKYKNSKIKFKNKISIWQKDTKITSNEAAIYFDNGIKKIILKNNPFIAILRGNIYPNQIKSDEVYMGFEDNKISSILFNKNVETLLFIFNNKDLKYINNLKTNKLCIVFDKDSNPMRALFNRNVGKIITTKDIDKNSNVLFINGYKTLDSDPPKFDEFSKKIKKISRIPRNTKLRFLRNK